jgi:uncharacterized protein (UPF0333 family)
VAIFKGNKFFLRKGQTALSFVFVLGVTLVLIGITLAILTISFLNSTTGFQASQRALAASASGVDDALLQLVRNRSFSDTTGYTVVVGSDSAVVTVTQNSPVVGQATIISTARASIYERKIRVIASVQPITGEVKIISRKRI